MKTHRDLLAWKEAMQLARMVYRATERFPRAEEFGLALQLRRAVVSVASNIAEGAARQSSREFVQFLSVSLGSLAELDTQIELAASLGLIDEPQPLQEQHSKVAQLTTKLRQSILRRVIDGSRITDHGSHE
ncbi:MAG: four helix bundle protein [Gemmatimonadota bacterium]